MLGEAAFYGTVLAVLFAPIPEHMHPEVLLESSVLVLLGLRALVAFVMFFLYTNWPILRALWIYRHIPGPIPLPFVGNMRMLRNGKWIDDMYKVWQKEYGNVFKWFMGDLCVIVFTDLEHAREVGLRKFSGFGNHISMPSNLLHFIPKRINEMSTYGLFSAKDKYWKGLRSTSASIFHNVDNLSSFMSLMKTTANELTERLNAVKEGESIDIWRALGDMTLDVVGSTVFGVRFNAIQSKDSDEVKAARIIFANGGLKMFNNPYVKLSQMMPFLIPVLKPLSDMFPTKRMKEMKWADDVLYNLCESVLGDTEKDAGKGVADAPAGPKYEHVGDSFLKLFAKTHNRETGSVLARHEITAQAFIFTLAGYETTANTLAYCIYLLATNKDKEKELIKEIQSHKSCDIPSLEDLKSYEYTEGIVREALRMYSPVAITNRQATQTTKVKDIVVRKNGVVHMTNQIIHRNPKYFPNPDQFLPERFIPNSSIYEDQNHQAFMAWGIGPRMCVASNFALIEAKLALITLYKRFSFTLAPGYEFKTKMGTTVSPVDGLKVNVHKH